MPLKLKSKEKLSRRHREDHFNFYKLRHSFDELPLDPAKSFINEKIRK